MTTISLAFYYRIFPILFFRRLLVWVAVVSLLYMVAIDLTIIFQWYTNPALPLPNLKLRYVVIPFTSLGTVSIRMLEGIATTLMASSLVAAQSMSS